MKSSNEKQWWVYLIRTRHNALYCGVTTDLQRRFIHHQNGKGAKALKGKGPLELVWWKAMENKSLALKEEAVIKKLTKAKKEALASEFTLSAFP